jgi:hypothetical protein
MFPMHWTEADRIEAVAELDAWYDGRMAEMYKDNPELDAVGGSMLGVPAAELVFPGEGL